jgi:hypothetical protein
VLKATEMTWGFTDNGRILDKENTTNSFADDSLKKDEGQ